MDNLNTHSVASLYETFPPEEALRLLKQLEIHYTLKHGSWLNIAEGEFSVLQQQCLDRRVASSEFCSRRQRPGKLSAIRPLLEQLEVRPEDARVPLKKLYPSFLE